MKLIGPNGIVEPTDYKEWPLFQEFRQTELFLDKYEEIFGEEFKIIERKDILDDAREDYLDE